MQQSFKTISSARKQYQNLIFTNLSSLFKLSCQAKLSTRRVPRRNKPFSFVRTVFSTTKFEIYFCQFRTERKKQRTDVHQWYLDIIIKITLTLSLISYSLIKQELFKQSASLLFSWDFWNDALINNFEIENGRKEVTLITNFRMFSGLHSFDFMNVCSKFVATCSTRSLW